MRAVVLDKETNIKITRFEPNKVEDPIWWDVGFTITNHESHVYYVPTTVYVQEITPTFTTDNIIKVAVHKVLLHALVQALTIEKLEPPVDFFDTLPIEGNDGNLDTD